MRRRVVSVVVVVLGLAIATIALAQPVTKVGIPAGDTPLLQMANLSAEIELLQLEHDVESEYLKKLMTEVRKFDGFAEVRSALLKQAKPVAAGTQQARTASNEEPGSREDDREGLSMGFDSFCGYAVNDEQVGVLRPRCSFARRMNSSGGASSCVESGSSYRKRRSNITRPSEWPRLGEVSQFPGGTEGRNCVRGQHRENVTNPEPLSGL